MMKQATILTTDIEFTSTMDVSKDNDTYNIGKDKLPDNRAVAAGSWLKLSSDLYTARVCVLRFIFKLIMTNLPKLKLWYFVGDSAWQDDTRIIRHKKLWKGLKAIGVEISHAGCSYEEMHESDGKLRFFGAKTISELSIESVVRAIAKEHCSYLLALPEKADVTVALHSGWDVYDAIDKGILQYVMDNEGLLLKVVGEFDDPESGFVGLGEPEIVKKLIQ